MAEPTGFGIRVDEDVCHPHRHLYLAEGFDLYVAYGELSGRGQCSFFTHITFVSSVQVAHVRDIDLECALYFVVFCKDRLDGVVVVLHIFNMADVLMTSDAVARQAEAQRGRLGCSDAR